MKNQIEQAVINFAAVGALVLAWLLGSSFEEEGIANSCDNNGGFVYEDVRYTCERVGP